MKRSDIDEDDLLQRLHERDSAARVELRELCRRVALHPRAPRVRRDQVEDLISEVYVRALAAIGADRGPETSLSGWLVGIARYTGYEMNRQAGREIADIELPEQLLEQEFGMGRHELIDTVRTAVHGIPPGLRPVMRAHLTLSALRRDEVAGQELALELKWSPKRIHRQLNRARKATIDAVAAVVLARSNSPEHGCADLSRILGGALTPEQGMPDVP